ncbi:MAG: carbon-nitrogen hydrolase family protein [Bacteroidales bacterium]|nr:carbon-nitrogen hydrolase family protein [Bacteroidales bacterium]
MASEKGCSLITFGEAILPGYPFWISLTDGAKFNSKIQKELHSYYFSQAIQISNGDLDSICSICKNKKIALVLGCIELAKDRGNHSVYCSLVFINNEGEIKSVHRKLVPTYEERLSWSPGDGHGLQVHQLGSFTLGALNCWENWMPLVRATLYGLGEDLHVAIWPGCINNTEDITKFIAKESRSFVISVSGLLRKEDITEDIPNYKLIRENSNEIIANGGSCLSGPDGEWLLSPQIKKEELFTVEIDHEFVRQERLNFDPSGHYSRPDVTQLTINRKRQSVLNVCN